jgi:hypothetical protein
MGARNRVGIGLLYRPARARICKPFKGHGNEADFLGFLQKLVPHRSLTLPFELFRFWLRIRGDIRNRKTTPRLGESATLRLGESMTLQLGESAFECLKENSASRRLSPTRLGSTPLPSASCLSSSVFLCVADREGGMGEGKDSNHMTARKPTLKYIQRSL